MVPANNRVGKAPEKAFIIMIFFFFFFFNLKPAARAVRLWSFC